jgi:hypothetical protein
MTEQEGKFISGHGFKGSVHERFNQSTWKENHGG